MLVDYSDSDASDTEASPAPPPPPKPTSGLAALLPKPKGARKGDPADNGPKKIVVNLPNINDAALDQPPTKKARIGGGGSSLSAMLPAPKKRKEAEAAAATESKDNGDFAPVEVKKPRVLGAKSAGAREVGEVLMPSTDRETGEAASEAPQVLGTKGNSTMFVPQSVVGRKTIQPMSAFRKKSAKGAATGSIKVAGAAAPQPKAKVSLFGSTTTASAPLTYTGASTSTGEYKPIMLESVQPAPRPRDDVEDHDGYEEAPNVRYGTSEEPQRDELDALVSEVGLDEAAVSFIPPSGSTLKLTMRKATTTIWTTWTWKRASQYINVQCRCRVSEERGGQGSWFSGGGQDGSGYPVGQTPAQIITPVSAITEGCAGRPICTGEEKQEGSWVEVWMVGEYVFHQILGRVRREIDRALCGLL